MKSCDDADADTEETSASASVIHEVMKLLDILLNEPQIDLHLEIENRESAVSIAVYDNKIEALGKLLTHDQCQVDYEFTKAILFKRPRVVQLLKSDHGIDWNKLSSWPWLKLTRVI